MATYGIKNVTATHVSFLLPHNPSGVLDGFGHLLGASAQDLRMYTEVSATHILPIGI